MGAIRAEVGENVAAKATLTFSMSFARENDIVFLEVDGKLGGFCGDRNADREGYISVDLEHSEEKWEEREEKEEVSERQCELSNEKAFACMNQICKSHRGMYGIGFILCGWREGRGMW